MPLENIAKKPSSTRFSYGSACAIFIGLFVLLIIAQASGIMILGREGNRMLIAVVTAGCSLIAAYVVFVLSNAFFKKMGFEKTQFLKLNTRTFKTFLISVGIVFFVLIASGGYYYFTTGDIKYLKLFLLTQLSVFIFNLSPAIMEEFIFRGFLLNFFKQKNRTYLGLTITSCIFGVVHLIGIILGYSVSWLDVFSITAGGFFLGLMYLNFGLFSSVVVHYAWNVSQVEFEGKMPPTYILVFVCVLLFLRLRRSGPFPRVKE